MPSADTGIAAAVAPNFVLDRREALPAGVRVERRVRRLRGAVSSLRAKDEATHPREFRV